MRHITLRPFSSTEPQVPPPPIIQQLPVLQLKLSSGSLDVNSTTHLHGDLEEIEYLESQPCNDRTHMNFNQPHLRSAHDETSLAIVGFWLNGVTFVAGVECAESGWEGWREGEDGGKEG